MNSTSAWMAGVGRPARVGEPLSRHVPGLATLYDQPDEPYGAQTAIPGPSWLSWLWQVPSGPVAASWWPLGCYRTRWDL